MKNSQTHGLENWMQWDKVQEFHVKKPFNYTRKNDRAITGSFNFRKAEHFLEYCDKTIFKNQIINNEFYLNIVLDECVIRSLNIQPFELNEYNSWGTPFDFKNI